MVNSLYLETRGVSSDSVRALFRKLAILKTKHRLTDILIETNYCDDSHVLSLNAAGQHTSTEIVKIFVPVDMPERMANDLVGDVIDAVNDLFNNRVTIVKSTF